MRQTRKSNCTITLSPRHSFGLESIDLVAEMHLFSAYHPELNGKRLALCFFTKWQEHDADKKGNRRKRHRRSDRVIVSDTRADQESNTGAAKPPDRGCKCKGAGPAFGAVLLRQPERIH